MIGAPKESCSKRRPRKPRRRASGGCAWPRRRCWIETARADFTQEASEEPSLRQLLSSSPQLEPAAVQGAVRAASAQLDESTSLYEFTRVINDATARSRNAS